MHVWTAYFLCVNVKLIKARDLGDDKNMKSRCLQRGRISPQKSSKANAPPETRRNISDSVGIGMLWCRELVTRRDKMNLGLTLLSRRYVTIYGTILVKFIKT